MTSGARRRAFRALRLLPPPLLLLLALASPGPPAFTDPGEGRESFVLPPYLDMVVLDVLHEGPGTRAALFAPDAPHQPLSVTKDGVEELVAGPMLRIVVLHRPTPGVWSFEKPHPAIRVQVALQRFFPRGVLVEPNGPRALGDHVTIVYRLRERGGSPFTELAGFPLHLEASLTGPDAVRRPLLLERRPEMGALTFAAGQAVECAQPGRHWIEVVVLTRDLFGRRIEVFRDNWSGFLVHTSG